MIVTIRQCVFFFWVMVLGLTASKGQIVQPDPRDRRMANLVVSSNVNGASVYLDSLFLGVTPIEARGVLAGVYQLRVIHPYRRSWYRDSIQETIELKPDERFEYDANFEYLYPVHSIPYGASILYDNTFKGETPAVLRTPERLIGSLLLKKDGYEDATFDLDRWEGGVIELLLRPSRGIGYSRTFLNVDSPRIRHKTPILISGIVGIASGVAAVYFKHEADESFTEYQRTRDPKLLSRTDQYDTISGLSLVAFELSLASLTYLLLSQ